MALMITSKEHKTKLTTSKALKALSLRANSRNKTCEFFSDLNCSPCDRQVNSMMEHLISFVREIIHDRRVILETRLQYQIDALRYSRPWLKTPKTHHNENNSFSSLYGKPFKFDLEDSPKNYATEYARMVHGQLEDGTTGACLAMTYDLAQAIVKLFLYSKELSIKDEQEALCKAEKKDLEAAITRIIMRKRVLEKKKIPTDRATQGLDRAKLANLEYEFEALRLRERSVVCDLEQVRDARGELQLVKAALQEKVNDVLEKVFIDCGLIDYEAWMVSARIRSASTLPPRNKAGEAGERSVRIDDEEKELRSSATHQSSSTISPTKERHNSNSFAAEPAQDDIIARYQGAWVAHHSADLNLEKHREQYEEKKYSHFKERNKSKEAECEFDHKHLQTGAELTRKVIKAEEELQKAHVEAIRAGVAYSDLDSLVFTGRMQKGYDDWNSQCSVDYYMGPTAYQITYAKSLVEDSIMQWMVSQGEAVPTKSRRTGRFKLPRELPWWDSYSIHEMYPKYAKTNEVWTKMMNELRSDMALERKRVGTWSSLIRRYQGRLIEWGKYRLGRLSRKETVYNHAVIGAFVGVLPSICTPYGKCWN
ncbi:hypothetical protein EJ05DRAFT_484174 [Pseudovirgaria hyperparasitica]|uniref:Uncharacterized protein n=1 Tax=Pseudovirgaria hyperparasitica TaxID=470096 RepID=A0A6A6WEI1_9PEZI|nr:uncharacterized protein EJ05DRAFT_484174 [Pseudovirgaria hyperparasitica]KAF2760444.1 hypothetical protein EJ05DRAFT_484174 [Pseudovirgaria hyperparasitica]